MKHVYCSNCGLRLTIIRKALPKYGRIINLIEPHECLDEPVEFDLSPVDVPAFTGSSGDDKGKFDQKLNDLNKVPHDLHLRPFRDNGHIDDLGDRRGAENVKSESSSSAPRSLLDGIKSMHHSTPANDIKDEPDG